MNWRQEAIEQLIKYDAMVAATKTIPQELKRLKDELGLKSPSFIRHYSGKNNGPADDRIINNLVKQQELEKSYKNALQWVKVTNGAMSVLDPEEKEILESLYIRPQKGVVFDLCEDLGIEQSSVYRRRDQALYRFTIALYGTS